MKLVLNESEIVNKALSEGCIDSKKPSRTLNILAKYYFGNGMNKKQVRMSLESFMMKNFENYNSVKWQDSLDGIVYRTEKKSYELFNVSCINITKTELETISSINDLKLEKLAFVFLVYSKIYNLKNGNKSYWVNAKSREIFSDCKITSTSKNQQLLIGQLCNLGLLISSKVVDCTNDRVMFGDESSEVVITITDFREFVLEYLRWKGSKIINCKDCGVLIIQINNKIKACKKCAKEAKIIKDKEYYNLRK